MFALRSLIASVFLTLSLPAMVSAAGGTPVDQKHTLRFGWGDMMYEHTAYYPTAKHIFSDPSTVPENYRVKEAFGHRYAGHFFTEYLYRLKNMLSIGAQLDFYSLSWQSGVFDRYHDMVEQEPETRFYNFTFMPTVRVTYFHKGPVDIYSGAGAGVLLSIGESTDAAFALNLNLVGVQAGIGHWYGALDLGLLNACAGLKNIYMLGSRIVSLSINYAW